MSEERQSLNCSTCREPTRRVSAFADGHTLDDKPYHKVVYTCENHACSLKEIMDELERKRTRKQIAVQQENQRNCIKASDLRAMRTKTGMILYEASRLLDATTVQLSQWENEKAPIPLEVYNKARKEYRRVYMERMVNR